VSSAQTQILLHEGLLVERSGKPALNVGELAARGWKEVYQLTSENLHRAQKIGRSIIELAPESPKGHQLLAAALFHLTFMGFADDGDASRSEALQEAREAIRLYDRDEYSHWVLALIQGNLFGRLEEALAGYRHVLSLNPNFSLGFGSMGGTLAYAGRAEDAIEQTRRAMAMNPRDPSIFFRFSAMTVAHFIRGEFTQAAEWAQRAKTSKPNWWLGHAILTASYAKCGDIDEARRAAEDLRATFPTLTVSSLPFCPLQKPEHFNELRAALVSAGIPD
jgi:adenylate cyclase